MADTTRETIRPTSADGVLDVLRWAAATETLIEIRGRGSKHGWGQPVEAGAVLDLSGLSGIVSYEPEELVLTAAAGTPMAEIEAAIGARGQMLAFEPPDFAPLWGGASGEGSLGGTLACNLGGPRRFKAGAARDHALGVHAVSGRAELFKAGGRVVKNVTGYDLPKLMCGAFGTLGAMTLVTVKVLPAPPVTVSLSVSGLDPAAATLAMAAAVNSPFEVSGAAHLPPGIAGDTARTVIRIEGFPASVAARSRAVADLLAPWGAVATEEDEAAIALWRAIRDVAPFAAAGQDRPLWRVSVAPASGAALAAAVGWPFYLDWGGGLVWIAAPETGAIPADAGASRIRTAVAAAGGGHATLLRAPEPIRRDTPVFEPRPPALAAVEARVAAAFDPLHLLNRGRMGSGAGGG